MAAPTLFNPNRKEAEGVRQVVADDAAFVDELIVFFELDIPNIALGLPSSMDGVTTILYGLVLAPEAYELSSPFTLQATPGADGGLTLEESGIVMRHLRLSGHMGFKPRPLKMTEVSSADGRFKLDTQVQSFEVRGKHTSLPLSGQRQFQFLEDRIFNRYGDLKRDPKTAFGAEMRYHNVQDGHHFRVAAVNFTSPRAVRQTTIYRYHIELLVYDVALGGQRDLPRDAAKVSGRKQQETAVSRVSGPISREGARATLRIRVKSLRERILALTNTLDDVARFVRGVAKTIKDVIAIADSVAAFVNGVVDLITLPFRLVQDICRQIDSLISTFENLPTDAGFMIAASWRGMLDELHAIARHRVAFADSAEDRYRALGEAFVAPVRSLFDLNQAADDPARTVTAVAQRGTAPEASARGLRASEGGRLFDLPNLEGRKEYVVRSGDTLASLGRLFLGDPRLGAVIALLNGLRPPFISDTPLPGTAAPGTKILIPTPGPSPIGRTGAAILGVPIEAALEAQLLGTDVAVEKNSAGLYEWKTETKNGATDLVRVSGANNLVQAVEKRVTVERGSSVLFPSLGQKRLVGTGSRALDREASALRIREALLQDPRVAAVSSLRRDGGSPDTVRVEATVVPVGLNQPVQVVLPAE